MAWFYRLTIVGLVGAWASLLIRFLPAAPDLAAGLSILAFVSLAMGALILFTAAVCWAVDLLWAIGARL